MGSLPRNSPIDWLGKTFEPWRREYVASFRGEITLEMKRMVGKDEPTLLERNLALARQLEALGDDREAPTPLDGDATVVRGNLSRSQNWASPSLQQYYHKLKKAANYRNIRHKQQQRLMLLFHADGCPHRQPDETCPITPHCAMMKHLRHHMQDCTDQPCTVLHYCTSSRRILSHYQKGTAQGCRACVPLRESVRRNLKDCLRVATVYHKMPKNVNGPVIPRAKAPFGGSVSGSDGPPIHPEMPLPPRTSNEYTMQVEQVPPLMPLHHQPVGQRGGLSMELSVPGPSFGTSDDEVCVRVRSALGEFGIS